MPDRPATEPTDEIEITPEMIEAGAVVLAGFTRETETLEEGAIRIFLAMQLKRLSCGNS